LGKKGVQVNIIFTPTVHILKDYHPKPAKNIIPEWYKELESYMGGKKVPNGSGGITSTIKKCMPVFDVMTAGYIIFTHTDIYVSHRFDETLDKDIPYYEWAGYSALEFHPIMQAPTHPEQNGFAYPKFVNPWAITTPKGYSVLIVQPFHRDSVITILPAIVDTDMYNTTVHFPFVLKDSSFEGLIPAGTPIAQIIPFQRESWTHEVQEKRQTVDEHLLRVTTHFWDTYKKVFRQKKEFN
jgi:hypothetical protein